MVRFAVAGLGRLGQDRHRLLFDKPLPLARADATAATRIAAAITEAFSTRKSVDLD